MSPGIDEIRRAADVIRGQVLETPCVLSRTLSEITGAEVYLKFENLQFTASFNERGAFNRLSLLTPDERRRGVVAMSAGNHAQGVAYHGQRLGIPAVIVMPRHTSAVKVERTRGFGAEVVTHGETLGGGQRARPRAGPRARADLRASVRRPGGDRRPGDPRPRDAGRGAVDGHLGDLGRRRGTDRRSGPRVPTSRSLASRRAGLRRCTTQ
jgi:hypothetical protein